MAALIGLGSMSFAWLTWNQDSSRQIIENKAPKTSSVRSNIEYATETFGEHEFHLSWHTRFREIKKSAVLNAVSIQDLMSLPELEEMEKLIGMTLESVKNDQPSGNIQRSLSLDFTAEQKQRLVSADFSENFRIYLDYMKLDPFSNKESVEYSSPHFTIVPETMASYEGGNRALVQFMSNGSHSETILLKDKRVSPAKFKFTVSKTGTLKNIELDKSCGFPFVDQLLMSLIKQAPGKWSPAKDRFGNTVDQEFYFFFGEMGC